MTTSLSNDDIGSLRVEVARWTFAQLRDWLRYVTPLVLGNARAAGADVYGVGITPERNRLIVSIGDNRSRAIVDSVLATKHVPCQLVITEIGGPPNPIRPR